jgi:hypothetical protein
LTGLPCRSLRIARIPCCSQIGQYVKELYRLGPEPVPFVHVPPRQPHERGLFGERVGKSRQGYRSCKHLWKIFPLTPPCPAYLLPLPGVLPKNVFPKAAAKVRRCSTYPNMGREKFSEAASGGRYRHR